jgi:hypothetical protein
VANEARQIISTPQPFLNLQLLQISDASRGKCVCFWHIAPFHCAANFVAIGDSEYRAGTRQLTSIYRYARPGSDPPYASVRSFSEGARQNHSKRQRLAR